MTRLELFIQLSLLLALTHCGGCYSQTAVDEVWREHGWMLDTGMGVLDTSRVDFDEPTTDEGLRRVYPSLQKLKVGLLDLSNAHNVTNDSVPFIRQVTSLQEIMLQGTKITPDGVRQLKGMPALKCVWVGERPVFTRDGVEHLRHDLSGIKVTWIESRPTTPDNR